MEDQNAYFCDQCQKKVAIQKRTILKKLPNVLIIVLNRFDFDYKNMTRVKLNDYFEYPQSLDLKAFTQRPKDEAECITLLHSSQFSSNYYKYDLTGVVVH